MDIQNYTAYFLDRLAKRDPGQKIFLCGCMAGQEHVVNRIKNR